MAVSNYNRAAISDPSGYAAVAALLTCAALSIMVAGGLNLSQTQDKRARQMFRVVERDEALNEALMRFGAQVQDSPEIDHIEGPVTLGAYKINVRAENEGLKWPLSKIGDLTTVAFNHKAKGISLDDARSLAAHSEGSGLLNLPKNDCFRQVFSPFGQATTDDVIVEAARPVLTSSTSKEGQVWRLRAQTGQMVREVYVRFIGRPEQLFAVIAEDDFKNGEARSCQV